MTEFLVVILLLLGNAFFVGSEFAVIASRRTVVEPILSTLAPAPVVGADAEAATGAGDIAGATVTVSSGARTWRVDGVLREDELFEVTGFRLPEGPYETLAGFIMARLGHIPVAGETVAESGWEFTVIEVERRRVERVRVVAPETSDD